MNNTEIDKKIQDVLRRTSGNYRQSSILEIVMEYYTLCEMITESLNPELENAAEELEVINSSIRRLADRESLADIRQDYDRVRRIITDKMNCITAYVDRFLVFDHVLNMLAPSFEMSEEEVKEELQDFDAATYTMEILRYIFSTQDNMAIHERIYEIIECMPVRMSRKKYLGLVEKGLALYGDSDKASFDEYVYMLRTSSMLYDCDGMAEGYDDLRSLYEELIAVDYASLDEKYYGILREKLGAATVKLGNLSDVYVCLQKIINMLYVYSINEDADFDAEFDSVCVGILDLLYGIIDNDASDVSGVETELVKLEGCMESLYEERNTLIPLVDEMEITYANRINELGLDGEYGRLETAGRLMGGLFAEVRASEYEEVTPEYADKVKEELIADMENLIKNNNRLVVRAVMSLTLGKLPLSFTTSDDVKDYILNSLEHCSNMYEMAAVKRYIDDLNIV